MGMAKAMEAALLLAASAGVGAVANASEWAVVYTGEAFGNLSGGLSEDDGYLGNLDATIEWGELDWFGGGGRAFVYVLGNHGDSPGEVIGDAQGYSNIDAPETIKLYEIWFEQPFADGAASWKLGLIDLNSEFDVVEAAGLFQNSSFGIGPDFSQSGLNGPSIFPTTSFGGRLLWSGSGGIYAACIALDGVPGDPDDPEGTHVELNSDDGVLTTCEAGREDRSEQGQLSKFNVGYWRYSEPFERLDGSGDGRSQGAYASYSRRLWHAWREPSSDLYGFVRFGVADDAVNPYRQFLSAGLQWTGVLARDGSDALGLAAAQVENGAPFRQVAADAGQLLESTETVVELAYRIELTPWLAMQPSVQRILQPGFDPALDDATAVSIRFELGIGGSD